MKLPLFLLLLLTTGAQAQMNRSSDPAVPVHTEEGRQDVSHRLEAYMQAQADVNQFGGTVLVMRHDSVLLHRAYGFADYEWDVPNTVDTRFVLASVTKYMTAIAILQLVEKGKLSTDDHLSRFFPDYPKGDSVTIHMLLTHTAGLALDFEEVYLQHTAISRDSVLLLLQRKPYLFSPGTNCQYSNIGYFLLSQIIEQVSGETYAGYLRVHIFEPAGMKNTGVSNNDSLVHNLSRAYPRSANGYVRNPYINWNLCRGFDGIYSTTGDLYKLDRALYGETLLSEATKTRMATPYNKKYPDNGFFENYGYGLFVNPFYNHGHYMLTHAGGYYGVTTSFDRYPEDDVFITVLSNNQSASHLISYGLSAIVFGIPVELPYQHTATTIDNTLVAKYAGSYGSITILKIGDQLYYNNAETPLLPESDARFFRAGAPDRTVEFVTDKKGRVVAIIIAKTGGVMETIMKTAK